MPKEHPTLKDIIELHRAGDLDAAKQGYLSIYEKNPNDAEVLHYLGIVSAELGELDPAKKYLHRALEINPQDSSLYLHLANIEKAEGSYDVAVNTLLKGLDINPEFAAGYNNLGTVYFAQGKWTDAINAFKTAINVQSDYVDAYYNLGLAHMRSNHTEEAIHVYRALLELAPHHAGGRFQWACLLMRQNKYQDAAEQFAKIEQEYPYHFETQFNLASCFIKLGSLSRAHGHYLKALTIMPKDEQVLFNLGVISTQLGKLDQAIEYYSRAIAVNPNAFETQNNLAVTYMMLQKPQEALQHFREAERIQPTNQSIKHIIQVLTKDSSLKESPPEYIRSLFDSYADHYEGHVAKALHYAVPDAIKKLITEHNDLSQVKWDILDLGCGTGLCGQLFKSNAHTLIGVDLSGHMLSEAAKKQCYDQLVRADLFDYLKDKQAQFDLIIAGDVLVYCGELEPLFKAVYKALRPGGLFVFNTEILATGDYSVLESGRFAHTQAYLNQCIQQTHFTTLRYQRIALRTQEQAVIQGHLYLVEKKP